MNLITFLIKGKNVNKEKLIHGSRKFSVLYFRKKILILRGLEVREMRVDRVQAALRVIAVYVI